MKAPVVPVPRFTAETQVSRTSSGFVYHAYVCDHRSGESGSWCQHSHHNYIAAIKCSMRLLRKAKKEVRP